MNITVKGRDTKVTASLQEYAEKRMERLAKLIEFDEASVVLKVVKDKHRAEITIPLAGTLLRAEQESADMYASIDQAGDKLERQIDRYKAKWGKKGRSSVRNIEMPVPVADAEEEVIIRSKQFSAKPMPVEEAIIRMNLLEHGFFVFLNAETDKISVVYKRNDGGYGLLEPEA